MIYGNCIVMIVGLILAALYKLMFDNETKH